MDVRLDGKRALVTGANSGIGAAISREFGAAGARVAVNYLAHPKAARDLCREIEAAGGEALPLQADISDPAAVGHLFAEVDQAWGGLDVLVNNAGIDGPRERGWEARLEDWRGVFEVNLFGAFYCAQEALRRMVPAGTGTVINLTSVHETIPWSGYSAYTASKAGLSMLTRTLAQEAAPYGVRVLALAPGAIESPINRAVREDRHALEDLLEKIPEGALGDPVDIARMAVMLASDLSRYVTGTTVYVDGGMTLFPSFTQGG
ncbi:MAG TPA: SDR family oxidoreductase [Gammaproteobacteria bacterium]|nr:SDR family oxidoreductase [Gammaproteobacteria bacterium]